VLPENSGPDSPAEPPPVAKPDFRRQEQPEQAPHPAASAFFRIVWRNKSHINLIFE